MDEMKLSLSTKLMRGVLAKIVSKMIKKKLGYKVKLNFNEIDFDMIDGETHLHLNVDANMSGDEFKKLLKAIEEES